VIYLLIVEGVDRLRKQKTSEESVQDEIVLALVCHYLLEGLRPSEIKDKITNIHKIPAFDNKDIWGLIAKAGEKKMLSFISPEYNDLSIQIRQAFPFDRPIQAHVTMTSFIDDVATRGALVVLRLIKDQVQQQQKKEVNLGFSGGHTIRKVFRKLAHLLKVPSDSLPERIVFHALVAGFETTVPGTDPTSFFTFLADHEIDIDTDFVLFHAPPIVTAEQFCEVLKLPAVKYARDRADTNDLDIIVTSAASFSHNHSQLKTYYSTYSSETIDRLSADGCKGDMLWLPVNEEGPIDTSTYPYRAVTALELDGFPKRVKCGKNIVLVLGPCAVGSCADPAEPYHGALKTDVLDAILHFKKQFITDLVIDARTARDIVERNSKRPAA
jgi:DNA-binding transcriptional regulator LsrR (DeoR family)